MSDSLSFKSLATGAFSLSAALAWNEFARTAIDRIYPDRKDGGVKATLIYAMFVTALVVVLFYIIRHAEKVDWLGADKQKPVRLKR